MILTAASPTRMRFAGLISRCTTPFACANPSASAAEATSATTCARESSSSSRPSEAPNPGAPDSSLYLEQLDCDLAGPLDVSAFTRAWQRVVDRHAALRTTFPSVGGEPCRQVAAELEFKLACVDAAGWSDERLREHLAAEAWRPFDLEHGPLLRATLLTGLASGPVLLLVVHHIVSDFWSLAIVMREVPALYRGEQLPPPGLPGAGRTGPRVDR